VRPTVTLDITAGGIWVYCVYFMPSKAVFLTIVRMIVLSSSDYLTNVRMIVLPSSDYLTNMRIIVKKPAAETGARLCEPPSAKQSRAIDSWHY
jgi:hypothetical protein